MAEQVVDIQSSDSTTENSDCDSEEPYICHSSEAQETSEVQGFLSQLCE